MNKLMTLNILFYSEMEQKIYIYICYQNGGFGIIFSEIIYFCYRSRQQAKYQKKKCPRSTHTSIQAIYIYFVPIKAIFINVYNLHIQQYVAWNGAYLCLPIKKLGMCNIILFQQKNIKEIK